MFSFFFPTEWRKNKDKRRNWWWSFCNFNFLVCYKIRLWGKKARMFKNPIDGFKHAVRLCYQTEGTETPWDKHWWILLQRAVELLIVALFFLSNTAEFFSEFFVVSWWKLGFVLFFFCTFLFVDALCPVSPQEGAAASSSSRNNQ